MPIHLHWTEHTLEEKQLTDYWGYNTLSFFAPGLKYLKSIDI